MDVDFSGSTDDDDLHLNVAEQSEQNVISKKKRGTLGKMLFPWKTKYGPELKKGLLKVIYLHGMHLSKGCDKLTRFKKNDEKWRYIADEFWKQPCCQSLKVNREYRDLQPPSGLSVKCELDHILSEVKNAMHWEDDSMANLSQMEGDLPEYESIVRHILIEQEQQRALEQLKRSQDQEKEKNEVTVLRSGLSKSADAELKVTSKAIRKRERDNSSSEEPSSSGTSSSFSSGYKAMSYFDKMTREIHDEEVKLVSTSKFDKLNNYDYKNMQKSMFEYLNSDRWWDCVVINNNENTEYDPIRVREIGLKTILLIFCRKPEDIEYFTTEMKLLSLSYLGAYKLYQFLSETLDNMQTMNNNIDSMTPLKK